MSRRTAHSCLLVIALLAPAALGQYLYPSVMLPTACQSGSTTSQARNGILVDLDQDGDSDLFGWTAGYLSAPTAVVVCLASGGTLGPGTCYPSPPIATAAAADLDGDGDQDVVAVTQSGGVGGLLVFLNNGAGGFPTTPISVPMPFSPYQYTKIAIGRMNNDPFPDVALFTYGGVAASRILIGTGGGNFAAPIAGPTTAGAVVAVQDDDLDGDDDIHEINGFGNFITYRNNGAAGFAAPIVRFAVPSSNARISFVDVNVDGIADAVVAGNLPGPGGLGAAFILVALGGPGAVLTPGATQLLGTTLGLNVTAFADFDGDLDPDLLGWTGTNGSSSGAFQSLNNAGTFSTVACVNVATIGGIAVGDVTSDGLPDAIFFGINGAAALDPGVPTKGLAHPSMFGVTNQGHDFHVADVDGDGSPDAVVDFNIPSPPPGVVGVETYLNIDSSPTAPWQTIQMVNSALDIATGDWNRDGATDVLLGSGGPDLRMLIGGPSGVLASPAIIATGVAGFALVPGDLNQDGKLDVVVNHGWAVSAQLGDGAGGFGSAVWTSICPTPLASWCPPNPTIAVDDLDQDGNLDLVVAIGSISGSPGSYSVYLGNGTGAFGPGVHTSTGSPILPMTLVVRDLNGDTVPDILLSVPPSAVEVRFGIGAGAFGPAVTIPAPGATQYTLTNPPVAGDMNGDGFADVAFPSGRILINDGAGGFSQQMDVALPEGSAGVAIADTNHDLQQDLVFWSWYPIGWINIFHNLTPCTGTGFQYGFGCPGTGGFVPSLSARGCASPGGSLTLSVDHARGGSSQSFFVVGPATTNVQVGLGCGVLVQLAGSFAVPFPLTGLATPGQGRASVPVVIPPSIPPGTSLAVQAAILDPFSPFTWSGTNGLALTIQ